MSKREPGHTAEILVAISDPSAPAELSIPWILNAVPTCTAATVRSVLRALQLRGLISRIPGPGYRYRLAPPKDGPAEPGSGVPNP